MMPVWMDIYREVQRDYAEGRLFTPAPTAPPVPAQAPAPLPIPPPLPSEESSGHPIAKAALVVGGLGVGGLLAKFLYNEFKYLGLARKIERGSRK